MAPRVTVGGVAKVDHFLDSSRDDRMGYQHRRRWLFLSTLFLLAGLMFFAPTSTGVAAGGPVGQEKSVKPGINKSFQNADVGRFVERFEREGREVYDFREEIVAKTFGASKAPRGMAVADIGAGTGLFTRLFASRVGEQGRVYAVDIIERFVRHVRKSCQKEGIGNVVGVVCTPSSVELPENSIDLAFICDTYHHFEFPYKTMRSIHRALKPSGHVILLDFHRIPGKSSDWILNHVRAGKETFVGEIVNSGFEVVGEDNFLKTSYFVRFKKSNRLTAKGHTLDTLATVKEMIQSKTGVVIDVREQKEWDAGHLPIATLIPLSGLRDPAKRKALIEKLPKDNVVYCHCRSGGRVLIAAQILRPLVLCPS